MTDSNKSLQKILLAIALIGLGALALLFICYLFVFGIEISHAHSTWAEFGGFFGGAAGPIFGLLSLLAVLYTIYIQTIEIRRSSKAQEEATNYSRLNALVTLYDHYQEVIPTMEKCANDLAGTEEGASAGKESIETRRLLREVTREIEKYHSELIDKKCKTSS
jgi:uncharacterized membrane protein